MESSTLRTLSVVKSDASGGQGRFSSWTFLRRINAACIQVVTH